MGITSKSVTKLRPRHFINTRWEEPIFVEVRNHHHNDIIVLIDCQLQIYRTSGLGLRSANRLGRCLRLGRYFSAPASYLAAAPARHEGAGSGGVSGFRPP